MQMPIIEARSRRDELDLPAGALIFATTGQITAERRMDLALRAFSKLLQSFPNAVYLIVGQVQDEIGLASIIAELDIQDKVHIIGFAPDKQSFIDWTATADVIINLRYPTVGETSASALRAMAAGRPVIVFDHGTYSELPDEACLKISPMDEEALLAGMQHLASDQKRRESIGWLAIDHIKDQHDPSVIAHQSISFFYELLASFDRRYGGVS
jgi:glycosyltransferase involved in cell wall biosynthesis